VSKQEDEILRQLQDGAWRYGLDLVKASQWRLARGTVYIHLSRLEDEGVIESEADETPVGQLPRRRYRLRVAR